MEYSQIGSRIKQSVTLLLNQTAKQLRESGEPVIHLGGGEPKSRVPESAIEAAQAALLTREMRYAPAGGIVELKDAVIDYTANFYQQEVERQNIVISAGAKQAIMVALKAILNPFDEVIIIKPYWVSYPEMVKICNGLPVIVGTDENFQPDIENIRKAVTLKTKVIIVNSPNNPTGVVYSEKFIKDIVKFCEEEDIYLFMDDIYHRLVFDNTQIVSSFKFLHELHSDSKLVIFNGVSKQYAMTGFRIGWAIGNRELIKIMTNIQGHETSGAATISQYAAIGALKGDQQNVADLVSSLQENRNILIEEISQIPNVRMVIPEGTFYSFADFSYYNDNSTALAQTILEKVCVVTVPGIEFGLDGYLRISTCGSKEDIIEGMRRMKWLLDPDSESYTIIGDKKITKA